MLPPVRLEISTYPDDDGFFLRYLDADGCEMTDTRHQSLADAMHQAEFEFGVKPTDWQSQNGLAPEG